MQASRRTAPGPNTPPPPRTWDARLARRLVTPLVGTAITPNHLTTVRLLIGVAGAACLAQGSYGWINAGAWLVVLSNFVDHTDGELARISGQSSAFGHAYDLASDAVVTVLLFASIGVAVAVRAATADATGSSATSAELATMLLGVVAGVAVAVVFFLRMRMEARGGKADVRQSFAAGFETEDVLYLLPLVTVFDGLRPFLVAAAVGAPLFALWVAFDYWRAMHRPAAAANGSRGPR